MIFWKTTRLKIPSLSFKNGRKLRVCPRHNISRAAPADPIILRFFTVDVVVNGKVYGSGSGHGKQAATKAAAQEALTLLGLAD